MAGHIYRLILTFKSLNTTLAVSIQKKMDEFAPFDIDWEDDAWDDVQEKRNG